MRKTIMAAAVLASPALTSAAIIPSWRINPISAAAIADDPALANALSVSLMVELTGGSLFNVAGLDLAPLPGNTFYNHPNGNSGSRPDPLFIPIFPAVEFDRYVATTSDAPAALPGRLNGPGTAQIAEPNNQFNVAWGATPHTGGTGLLEIARITTLHPAPGVIAMVHIPIGANGLVRDSLNPGTNVEIPPIPAIVPEPMSFAVAGLGVVLLRRRP